MSWWQRAETEAAGAVAIAPSLLAADASRLAQEVGAVELAGADLLHLDVMDGHFVPNLTFGPHVAASIARTTDLPLDCHLMVTDPEAYAPRFASAGAAAVSFHWEIDIDHAALARSLRAMGVKAGLVLNPPTECDNSVRKLLGEFDFILVMSVNPGFGGQSFDPRALPKLEQLAAWREAEGLDLVLEIDGGVNLETAPRIRDAGADILVSGSALFGTEDYAATTARLRGENSSTA